MTTSTDTLKAAISAAKWLISKVNDNSKLNPIPYPFFKSAVDRQIEWGKSQRGIILDFENLVQATRAELLKSGIHVMSKAGKSEADTTKTHTENTGSFEFVCNGCRRGNVDKKECPLYNSSVQKKERGENTYFMCEFYHDTRNCQMPLSEEIFSQEVSINE